MKILLIGGSKSGKSRLAQELVRSFGRPMVYWAAMEPADEEDRRRIEKHLRDRDGWGFQTLECGRALEAAFPLLPRHAAVLFDSITALLANEMFGAAAEENAGERAARELLALAGHAEHLVCVCDDFWREEDAYGRLTRQFQRELARICRSLAAQFDTVCEVTAGIPHLCKGRF